MSVGVWITLGIFLFFLGSLMALQPSAKQKALGKLREAGRKMQLNPRLVACPDWLVNARGEKGKGMVALYGLVLPDAKLPLMNALVIDEVMEIVKGNQVLVDMPCTIPGALGVTMQANFIGLYWDEQLDNRQKNTPQLHAEKLTYIKESLQTWAKKVQA